MKKQQKTELSLFQMQIKASPQAHRMSVAMSMIGLRVDIPSAHAMYVMLQKLDEMGSKFDLMTAVKIRTETFELFDKIEQEYNEKSTKKQINNGNKKNKRPARKGAEKGNGGKPKVKRSNDASTNTKKQNRSFASRSKNN